MAVQTIFQSCLKRGSFEFTQRHGPDVALPPLLQVARRFVVPIVRRMPAVKGGECNNPGNDTPDMIGAGRIKK